jgi:hypothetical protein
MRLRPPFTNDAKMSEWVRRLNGIPGLDIQPAHWTKRPSFDMDVLADPAPRDSFQHAMEWFWNQL